MRAITIEVNGLGSARRLYTALSEFYPEFSGNENEGYSVSVELGTRERRLLEVLDAIELYLTQIETDTRLVMINVDGHRYTMHPAHV